MTALFHKAFSFGRIIATLLLLIISIKTTSGLSAAIGLKKEIAAVEKADSEQDKKTDTDDKLEQGTEIATLTRAFNKIYLPYIPIKHHTVYNNGYSLRFDRKITIPPPDFC